MPGPSPTAVRLTDKQRESCSCCVKMLALGCARATLITCAEGLSNNEVARRENIDPGDSGEVAQGLLWRWVQGFARCVGAGASRVGVDFPMTVREALSALPAPERYGVAEPRSEPSPAS